MLGSDSRAFLSAVLMLIAEASAVAERRKNRHTVRRSRRRPRQAYSYKASTHKGVKIKERVPPKTLMNSLIDF
jgi:hypothetical protein